MHFDPRTQHALREAGLDVDDLRAVSEAIVEATAAEAADLEAFFDAHDVVYSDIEMAHSAEEHPEHTVEYIDLYTHGDDLRGWLRFPKWGVYVEGGRVLDDDLVELTLGPTVNDRARFAPDRDRL